MLKSSVDVHLFFFAPRGSAGKPVAHRKGKGQNPSLQRGSQSLLAFDYLHRLEGKLPAFSLRTMAQTRTYKELQGHSRLGASSATTGARLV